MKLFPSALTSCETSTCLLDPDAPRGIEVLFNYALTGVNGSVSQKRTPGLPDFLLSARNDFRSLAFDEIAGRALFGLLGLATPRWERGHVQALIDPISQVSDTPSYFRERPEWEVSPLIELDADPDARLYQLIPKQWYERVSNVDDLIGAEVAAAWFGGAGVNHIFLSEGESKGLKVVFFDFSLAFSYPWSSDSGVYLIEHYHLGSGRSPIWIETAVARWKEKIESITKDDLETCFNQVPRSWQSEAKCKKLTQRLLRRRAKMASLVVPTELEVV